MIRSPTKQRLFPVGDRIDKFEGSFWMIIDNGAASLDLFQNNRRHSFPLIFPQMRYR